MEMKTLLRVTISGPPGSGTSTLVSRLSKERNWSYINGGEIFRSAAKERNISIEEFSALCKNNLDVDKSLDNSLKEIMISLDSPEIVESRLCGWWARELKLNCKKIWISVSDKERAKRIQNREGGDFSDCLNKSRNRQKDDMDRYKLLYGINLDDLSPYNLIVEADDKDEDEVFQIVDKYLGF
jgi:cytidylate kinase